MRLTFHNFQAKLQGCLDWSLPFCSACAPTGTMEKTTDDVATIDIELAKTLITTIVRPARDFVSYQHAETDILAFIKLSVILYGR